MNRYKPYLSTSTSEVLKSCSTGPCFYNKYLFIINIFMTLTKMTFHHTQNKSQTLPWPIKSCMTRSLPTSPTSSHTTLSLMLLSHWHFITAMPHSHVLQCLWLLLVRSSSFKLQLKRVLRVPFLVTFLSKVDPFYTKSIFFFFSHTTSKWVNTTFQLYFQNISRILPLLSISISATLAKPPPSLTQMIAVSTCQLLPHLCPLHTLCSSLIDLLINSSDASCQGLYTCFASAWNVGHLDRFILFLHIFILSPLSHY